MPEQSVGSMSENDENKPSIQDMKITSSSDFQTIYANFVQGAFTPFDISLLVGDGFPSVTGDAQINLKARVVFSPVEAKLVIRILRGMVLSYENQFGEIKVSDSLTPLASTGNTVPLPTDDSEGV